MIPKKLDSASPNIDEPQNYWQHNDVSLSL